VGLKRRVGVADTITSGVGVATVCATESSLCRIVGVANVRNRDGAGVCSPPMMAKRSNAHPIRLMTARTATL
jgi:hypothetical protein